MKGKTAIMAIMIMLVLSVFSSSAFAACCCFCCPDWSAYKCVPREDFGMAYKAAVNAQILNPYAEKNVTPVEGIDGRAAVNIMKGYIDSFGKSQAAPPAGLTSFAVTQNPGGYTH